MTVDQIKKEVEAAKVHATTLFGEAVKAKEVYKEKKKAADLAQQELMALKRAVNGPRRAAKKQANRK